MPFTSRAQARFMYANHPQMAQEFAAATPSIKALPQHAGKLKPKKRRRVIP